MPSTKPRPICIWTKQGRNRPPVLLGIVHDCDLRDAIATYAALSPEYTTRELRAFFA